MSKILNLLKLKSFKSFNLHKYYLLYISMLIINCFLFVQAFLYCINNLLTTYHMIRICSPFFISLIILFLLSNYSINKLNIQ